MVFVTDVFEYWLPFQFWLLLFVWFIWPFAKLGLFDWFGFAWLLAGMPLIELLLLFIIGLGSD